MFGSQRLSVGMWLAVLAVLTGTLVSCGGDENQGPSEASGPNSQPDRDDVDCSTQEALGADPVTIFTSAHYVVDGQLGALCFGQDEPVLRQAWDTLAAITPPGQLTDLALFSAFEGVDADGEVTLAFVNTIDGDVFQMSINLDAFVEDENTALLTMAHEFSHVFTSTEPQLDRLVGPTEPCATYYNGEGCFLPDSIMAQWIDEFWTGGLIDEIDPSQEASVADGQRRCDANPGFLGAYAASNPEEDFAEAFGAYVYDVAAENPAQQKRLDWIADQPGLAEFRERAVAAGFVPLDFQFDSCGTGG